jgi:hypothetical protein
MTERPGRWSQGLDCHGTPGWYMGVDRHRWPHRNKHSGRLCGSAIEEYKPMYGDAFTAG